MTRSSPGSPSGSSSNAAVTLDGLGKKFRLTHDRNWTLKATMLAGHRTRYEEFWALRDLSLEVEQGQTFGIIGGNGSGKSTLLKVLAGILRPDEGTATVDGRLSALLELGAGFHPELTGRENVYLNGAILGFTKRDIRQRFDDIVGFAELDRFIDEPVRNYSSGMYVRLGFSVAIHVEPEVLLVDEVLAVGDLTFQKRCLDRFAHLKAEGRTIIVVSHDLDMVGWLCDRTAWIQQGSLQTVGPSSDVIDRFATGAGSTAAASANTGDEARPIFERLSENDLVKAVVLVDPNGHTTDAVGSRRPVSIRVRYDGQAAGEPVTVALGLYRADGTHVASINSGAATSGVIQSNRVSTDEPMRDLVEVDYVVPALSVQPGTYELSVALHDSSMRRVLERHTHILRFEVSPTDVDPQNGLVAFGGAWEAR
ncbi:MAG: ABC transporter ATP-binding protein [Actinomycetota bacterium]|nr:ABC transporter ATP-binding protein [Actinomycetota bacterium]MED5232941.1 ABC transporter ATP-binding protein [Actinomycetota bacterium]MEE3354607.1 ABC transporter ATP-binding protein [Actinomycetota bacterium]